jgi:hydroxyacylglutathione hydrolase
MTGIVNVGGRGYDSNIWIFTGDHPFAVDAGTGTLQDEVVAAIHELGITRLDALVLTHAHYDHVGGAAGLAEAMGGCDVYVHPDAVEPLAKGMSAYTGATMFAATQTRVDCKPLDDGQVLDLGGTVWTVTELPGHHPSCLILTDPRGVVFTGDVIFADGGVGRWDLPGGNLEQHIASVNRLATMDVTAIFPGHGPAATEDADVHVRMSRDALAMWARSPY